MIGRLLSATALLVALGSVATFAQAPVSDAALTAERQGRWDEAIRLHRAQLQSEPGRADLWVRIADIEAARGNLSGCIDALQQATSAGAPSAAIYSRLSQAYSSANQPSAALHAMEDALALAPDSVEYLQSRATLATWVGDYSRAADSYRRLTGLDPANADIALAFARVSAWAGETDEAVRQYGRYLTAHPDARDVWIELARAESWRGNYAGAVDALNAYRTRFGTSAAYSRELASVMASAGRPRTAERVVAPLLEENPDNLELHVTRTLALALQQRARDAHDSLEQVRQLAPASRETQTAERLVRTLLSSSAEPQYTAYSDSDDLQAQRFAPQATLTLPSGARISGGFDRTALDARVGSGLEQLDGTSSALYQGWWIGVGQTLGPVGVTVRGGYATAGSHDLVPYSVAADVRATETLRVALERSYGAFVISPRTVGMGLTQTRHQAQIAWTPTLRSTIVVGGSYQELSDGNHRLEWSISPRRSIARRADFNLDLGVSAYRLEVARDLDNGYYDPRRYEQYALTAYPYFKVSENVGLSVSTALGAQRDWLSPGFHLGATVSGEATFGIYDAWVLKVNGNWSMNRRLESGAFRGLSGGAGLIRRF